MENATAQQNRMKTRTENRNQKLLRGIDDEQLLCPFLKIIHLMPQDGASES